MADRHPRLTGPTDERSLGLRVADGALWSYAAFGAGRLIVFLGTAALAHLLSPADFGLFGMALALVSFFEVARDVGLKRSLIYFDQHQEAAALRQTAFILAVTAGLLLALLTLALAPLLESFYGQAEVGAITRILALYFLIGGFGVVPDALLLARLAFRRRFWAAVGDPLARYGLALALALAGYGVWSLVIGQVVGIACAVLLLLPLAGWRPHWCWRPDLARRLLGFGTQLSAVSLISAVTLNLDYVLVGRFLGAASVGVYTLAFRLPDNLVGAVGHVFSALLLPAYMQVADDRPRFQEAFLNAFRTLVLLLAPAAVGLALLAESVIMTLFGPRWVEAIPILQLLALWAFVNGILFSAGNVFIAAGRPGPRIAVELVLAIVLIPSLIVAAQISLIAVAAAHVVAILVYALVTLTWICRLLDLSGRRLIGALLPGLIGAVALAIPLTALLQLTRGWPSPLVLLISVPLGVLFYAIAIWNLDNRAIRQVLTLGSLLLRRAG